MNHRHHGINLHSATFSKGIYILRIYIQCKIESLGHLLKELWASLSRKKSYLSVRVRGPIPALVMSSQVSNTSSSYI